MTIKIAGKTYIKAMVLKKIMSKAWEIKKSNIKNVFSECLKMAWEFFKNPTIETSIQKVTVKSWFISNNENLTSQEKTAIKFEAYFGKVIKETEKAVQILFSTDFGNVKLWTPKSCLEIN